MSKSNLCTVQENGKIGKCVRTVEMLWRSCSRNAEEAVSLVGERSLLGSVAVCHRVFVNEYFASCNYSRKKKVTCVVQKRSKKMAGEGLLFLRPLEPSSQTLLSPLRNRSISSGLISLSLFPWYMSHPTLVYSDAWQTDRLGYETAVFCCCSAHPATTSSRGRASTKTSNLIGTPPLRQILF